jgi:hypothetical protein
VVNATTLPLYTWERGPVPIVQEAGSGLVRKILAPTGIRFPDRTAHSESLYRLRYPGPHVTGVVGEALLNKHGITTVVPQENRGYVKQQEQNFFLMAASGPAVMFSQAVLLLLYDHV